MADPATDTDRTPLPELARVFLKLGLIAFGGPTAHIALMRQELVQRRGWLSNERYLDLVGASALIPGPNSTEVAIHIGAQRGGRRGDRGPYGGRQPNPQGPYPYAPEGLPR